MPIYYVITKTGNRHEIEAANAREANMKAEREFGYANIAVPPQESLKKKVVDRARLHRALDRAIDARKARAKDVDCRKCGQPMKAVGPGKGLCTSCASALDAGERGHLGPKTEFTERELGNAKDAKEVTKAEYERLHSEYVVAQEAYQKLAGMRVRNPEKLNKSADRLNAAKRAVNEVYFNQIEDAKPAKDGVSVETLQRRVEAAEKRRQLAYEAVSRTTWARKNKGQRLQSSAEMSARSRLSEADSNLYAAKRALAEAVNSTATPITDSTVTRPGLDAAKIALSRAKDAARALDRAIDARKARARDAGSSPDYYAAKPQNIVYKGYTIKPEAASGAGKWSWNYHKPNGKKLGFAVNLDWAKWYVDMAAKHGNSFDSGERGHLGQKTEFTERELGNAKDASERCECEQANCHGSRGCPNPVMATVNTIYGPYKMCGPCAARLPADYKKARDAELRPVAV